MFGSSLKPFALMTPEDISRGPLPPYTLLVNMVSHETGAKAQKQIDRYGAPPPSDPSPAAIKALIEMLVNERSAVPDNRPHALAMYDRLLERYRGELARIKAVCEQWPAPAAPTKYKPGQLKGGRG
jgi:hypothetical protein